MAHHVFARFQAVLILRSCFDLALGWAPPEQRLPAGVEAAGGGCLSFASRVIR